MLRPPDAEITEVMGQIANQLRLALSRCSARALELHVSNITLIEETGEKRERQELGSGSDPACLRARGCSARPTATLAPKLGSAIDSRSMGSGRLGSATG